jgi:hypothetical protein
MALNKYYGLGRVYRNLPPHYEVKQLGDNIETIADYFLTRGSRNAMSSGPVPWEWHLGMDLKKVVDLLRTFVDDDIYTTTSAERQRREKPRAG